MADDTQKAPVDEFAESAAALRTILLAKQKAVGFSTAAMNECLGEIAAKPELLKGYAASWIAAIVTHERNRMQLGWECYLLPHTENVKKGDGWVKRDAVRWQRGYRGLVAAVAREKEVTSVDTFIVYENEYAQDRFEWMPADNQIRHKPILLSHERGGWLGMYAVIKWRGEKHIFWMDMSELCDWRDKYARNNAYKKGVVHPDNLHGVWKDNPEQMFRKTVLGRCANGLPFGREVLGGEGFDAEEFDAAAETIDPRHAAAEAADLTVPPDKRDPLAGALPAPNVGEREPGEEG